MANRSQLRTLLRRRLQEAVADQWEDSELDDLLNLGLARLQSQLMRTSPDRFIYRYTINLEADRSDYEFPAGFVNELLVEIKDSSGTYRQSRKIDYAEALKRAADDTSGIDVTENCYARRGNELIVSPTPTTSATAGLRLTSIPTLSMAADGDIPDIPLLLHIGIVYWGHIYALGETSESSKDTKEELLGLLTDAMNVLAPVGQPDSFGIDIGMDLE